MSRLNLSNREVASWLRAKGRQYIEMADEIDADSQASRVNPENLTVHLVVSRMNSRSMRKSTLARELGVDESDLNPILTEANGFYLNDRAWYSYKET